MSTKPLQVNEASPAYLARPSADDVPPGYKKTAVGVIPEDWDTVQLGDVASICGGATPSTRVANYWNGGIPWCTPTDITSTTEKYLSRTERTITQIGLASCAARLLPVGTLLLCSRATIGDVKIAATQVCTNQGFKSLVCHPGVENEFLYYLVLTLKPKLIERAIGSTFLEIGKSDLASIAVALPRQTEQRAIAEALSDVDALIAALDKLIAKKRAIKQAAMQQLLTGKTRLPGFNGEWETKRLGETAILKARIGWQGLTTAEYLDSGDYFLVTGTEFKGGYIDWSNCHYVAESRYKQDRNIQLKEHDVLVTKDGTIGKVALITHLPKPATLNSGIFVIRPIENAFHPEFFYYLLCSDVFTDFLIQLSAGSTINHLYQKDFVGFVYRTPVTIGEQSAIGTILADMDAEIASLEARRDKTRALKQGMMQQLLTGRVRLV